MSSEPRPPLPASCERDAEGRLTGLVFDSEPPLAASETNPWLVAVDGSDNALRAVAHAVRQAEAMHACAMHLINVQHWLAKEAAEAELARRAWHATETARALLNAKGLPWRLHVGMGDPPDQIIALAGYLSCTTIVIGTRGLGVVEDLLLGSVAYKLMHLSPYPVLVVR